MNQLTDSGFKNQKNQSKLIPLIPSAFYAGFEDLIVIFLTRSVSTIALKGHTIIPWFLLPSPLLFVWEE